MRYPFSIRGAAAILSAIFAATTAVASAQELIAPPRFDIERFAVTGNTLLPPGEVERIVAPYTGRQKDFGDIQRALERLEQAYRDRGFGVVQAILPEQDITKGVVQFRIVEPKVGKIGIEGNKFFNDANIRRSLPSVKEGQTPNSKAIARNLQILGENSTKQTSVLLRSSESEGQVDLNVKVADEKPWRVILTLDDSGTGDTGYLRSGIGFQYTNLFNRDHTLTAQYVTSLTHPNKVSIYGVGYHAPLYDLNSSVDFTAGYSDVSSGTVQGLFNVSGSGTILGTRWNYYLPRWGEIDQKLSFGLDYRAFQNQVTLNGVGLVPDVTVHPASVAYSGLLRLATAELSYYAAVSANLPGGSDGRDSDFQRSRAGATADYTILRYGMNFVKSLPLEWQARAAVNGQYTRDALVAGEQFGLGGPDSVRGYLLREVTNDRGISAQLELYTPDVAPRIGLGDKYRARVVAFYDFGSVQRNHALPGETVRDSIASAGLGVRVAYTKSVSLRVDLAQILQPAGTRQTTDQRVSMALALVF
jgi:hemolysin activation/secretion protein